MDSQTPDNEGVAEQLPSANNFNQDKSLIKKKENDSLIGELIGGRYEILESIGKGAHGSVYKAKDSHLSKTVALKVLHPDYMENKEIAARFQHEAALSSHIKSPHIVAASDYWICEKTKVVFIVMEHVPGPSLDKVMASKKPLEVARSLHIMIQLCEGMSEAHNKKVLHRDIKPSNILLTHQNNDPDFVKIADFGIAKVLDESDEIKNLGLTKTGEGAPGTYMYMSPEQCLGKPLKYSSDIYSMGCVFYELLTGKSPFDRATPAEILGRHMNGSKIPDLVLDSVEPVISSRLANIVSTALANEPALRYKSVDKLQQDLQSVQLRLNQSGSGRLNKALIAVNDFACGISIFLDRSVKRLLLHWKLIAVIFSIILTMIGIQYFVFRVEPPRTDRDLAIRACVFPHTAFNYVLNHFLDSIRIYDLTIDRSDSELEAHIDTFITKAESARLSGDFNQAIDKYKDSLGESKKENFPLENSPTGAEIEAHLAYCYLLGSDSIKLAQQAALSSLEIYKRFNLQNSTRVLMTYAILGESSRLLGDDTSARAYFDQFRHISFEHSIENVSPLELAISNVYAANFYRDNNEFPLAESLYRRAISYWMELKGFGQFNLGVTYNSRALLELKQNALGAAKQDLDNARKTLIRANADNHDLAIVLFNLSDVLFAEHNFLDWFKIRSEAVSLWTAK